MKNKRSEQITLQSVRIRSGTEGETKRLSDAETIEKAHKVRNKLAKDNKIPKRYLEIIAQAKSRINDHAYQYIPRLYETLRKEGFDKEVAKLTVIADGLEFGWSYNTIRKSIPTEAKNQNKAIGAKAATVVRNRKKRERQEAEAKTKSKFDFGDGDGHGKGITTRQESETQTFILTGQNVLDIYKYVENDLEHINDLRVKVQFKDEQFVNASLFR